MSKDEIIRLGTRLIKKKFLGYSTPQPYIPADSIIEECVEQIYEMIKNKGA